MCGLSDKAAAALLAITIGMTLLMCLCYTAIFIDPNIILNPYRPDYATAVAKLAALTAIAKEPVFQPDTPTATSGWDATWTPTITPIPSETPTPTNTRTTTPTASKTPTRTPFPTWTPYPTSTRPPAAPATPTPPALYTMAGRQTEANCFVVRIKGVVTDSGGVPISGVVMQVGEVGVEGSVFRTAPTDANGRYIWDFGAPDNNSHTWFVVPLEGGQEAVSRVQFQTDHGDSCESVESVQIVTIDWRKRN